MSKMLRSLITTEYQIQCSIIIYANTWRIEGRKVGDYLFHIPNGGLRTKTEAVRFKNMGVKAGIPDLLLAWPTDTYSGMFSEIKSKNGKLTELQKIMHERLREAGYYVGVYKELSEWVAETKLYLEGKLFP